MAGTPRPRRPQAWGGGTLSRILNTDGRSFKPTRDRLDAALKKARIAASAAPQSAAPQHAKARLRDLFERALNPRPVDVEDDLRAALARLEGKVDEIGLKIGALCSEWGVET